MRLRPERDAPEFSALDDTVVALEKAGRSLREELTEITRVAGLPPECNNFAHEELAASVKYQVAAQ